MSTYWEIRPATPEELVAIARKQQQARGKLAYLHRMRNRPLPLRRKKPR